MTLVIILMFAISILLVVDGIKNTREQRELLARIESINDRVSVYGEAMSNIVKALEALAEDLEEEVKNDTSSS